MPLDNKKVLVTGGTGTIGSQVVHELLSECAFVTVYSRDQNKQFKMNYDLSSKRVTFLNGDICDPEILGRAMIGIDYVVHCAASKHVPLCEHNADSAIKVNIEGTRNVLACALRAGVKKVLMLSTDKAVYPASVMGSTKFLAERVTLEYNKVIQASVVRLGNVFASNGSVVPTFMDRIKHSLPLVVNNPHAIRYFISQKDCGRFIVDRLIGMNGGEIFVKKMKAMTVQQLADAMKPSVGYPVEIGKLTQGEKLKEMLITQDETSRAKDRGDYYEISDADGVAGVTFESAVVQQFTDNEIKELLKESVGK